LKLFFIYSHFGTSCFFDTHQADEEKVVRTKICPITISAEKDCFENNLYNAAASVLKIMHQ